MTSCCFITRHAKLLSDLSSKHTPYSWTWWNFQFSSRILFHLLVRSWFERLEFYLWQMGKEICPKFATLARIADVNNLTLHHLLNCLPLLNRQPISASLHDWSPLLFLSRHDLRLHSSSSLLPCHPQVPLTDFRHGSESSGGAGRTDLNQEFSIAAAHSNTLGKVGPPKPQMFWLNLSDWWLMLWWFEKLCG